MVITAVAVGCGDDGRQERTTEAATTVTTGSLSKDQYLARINSYCRDRWKRILKRVRIYRNKYGQKMTDGQLFAYSSKSSILPGIQFQFDEMRRKGVPEGDERQVEEMVGTMQLAIEDGEKQRITSPQQLSALFTSYNQLAHLYGLRECIVREAFFGRVRPQDLAPLSSS